MPTRSRELLGPGGRLAEAFPGYEPREGQVRVAEAVERLLAHEGVLLCEAGTGIGKTFGYLVPALLSGRKVVVSTATKALQDQIAERDLPRLLSALGMNVPYAVMKGLGNYVCRRRFREFELSEEAMRPSVHRELEIARAFRKNTETGDLGELRGIPETSRLRLEIASSSETRLGPACPEFERCFVTEMRREAEAARIVIVNHHLFFADLALRGPHPGRVLPEYDSVLFDEAHQLEDTAALFFGKRVAEAQIKRLEKDALRILGRASRFGGELDARSGISLVDAFGAAAAKLFKALAEEARQQRGSLPNDYFRAAGKEPVGEFVARAEEVKAMLESRAALESRDLELREVLEHTGRRFEQLVEELGELIQKSDGFVTWLEVTPQGVVLSSTPVDLSGIFRNRLFERVPSVGLLSATLSTGKSGGFSFVRARLGISQGFDVEELNEPSPFDYEKRAVLYLPRDLPNVRAAEFLPEAAARIRKLVEATDGGAFVLTTSLASMRKLHELLGDVARERPLLLQGTQPKEVLLSAFRSSGRAVLVATASFWEGVDVPGHALRLVVLEKIPFSVPTDPVYQARAQALEAAGKSAFSSLALPAAQIALKQGFGRLIRRSDDRGVVALLDERVLTQRYGARVLSALPPARRESDLERVLQFARTLGPPPQ